MKDVLWQSRSELTYNSFLQNSLHRDGNGGNAYEFQAMQSLKEVFDFDLDSDAVRQSSENVLSYWRRLRNHSANAALVIRDPQVVAFSKTTSSQPQIAIIHHIDLNLKKGDFKNRFFRRLLLKQLRRTTAIVAVSQFWNDWLSEMGCSNVKVIYNSFELAEFEIDEQDQLAFRKKHELPADQPLIYIGNSTSGKGVEDVFRALKDEGYTLVTTGRTNHLNLPVRHWNLARKDYLTLLSACDVVITMSKMSEGWNRVAHEAMLCRTPVIGSGSGGMKELLSLGKQVMLSDCTMLPTTVREILPRKNELGFQGYQNLKKFDLGYFKDSWVQLIGQYIHNSTNSNVRTERNN